VRGGSSRYTTGLLRLKNTVEVPDEFADRLVQTSETFVQPSFLEQTLRPYDAWPPILRAYAFADPELVRAFVDWVPPSLSWMQSLGIRFEPTVNPSSESQILETVGGGEGAVDKMVQVGEQKGVIFHYETTGRSLIVGDSGEVIGINARSRSEGPTLFMARAVVLASGGFEGNPEMSTKYLGPEAYRLRTVSPGGMYNKGEGIEMALKIGAAPAGQYGGFHVMILDPRSTRSEAIKPWNYGILVNIRGERFVDEGADYREHISDQVGKAILRQPEGRAYFIYDAKIRDVHNYQRQIGSEYPPITGESIEDLAAKLDVNSSVLRTTIQDFNAAIQEGPFRPVKPDGKRTKGITPPKSNWARAIEGPEFMAYPVVCTNVFTFGGIRVSPRAQVVDRDGYEIPGLYAAGEVVGLYYGSYLVGTSFLRGIVFGYIAGRNAGGYCAGLSQTRQA
jgi:tricarballylate dehydrogenase